MKTGDVVTDSRQRSWTLGPALGRGTWGASWWVRDAAGRQAVLKAPLEAEDLRGQEVPTGAPAAMALLARESVTLLAQRAWPFLPVLEGEISLPSGAPAMVLPAYPDTLARRIEAAAALEDIMDILSRTARLLVRSGATHGNLRATNILLDDGGQPFLADPATPSQGTWARALESLRASGHAPWPPETEQQLAGGAVDTWAMCRLLLAAVLARPDGKPEPMPEAMDRHALADIKSATLARLAASGSNPRFRGRVADRVASLLNRGLSDAREPSPPYRFHRVDEFAQRLDEIVALLSPRIAEVGRLILGPEAQGTVFAGDRPLSFSANVQASAGIQSHDDIHVGLQLFDLDRADARVPIGEDLSFDAKVHASGRLRFAFHLRELPPGRYRVAVAFGIKDGTAPLTVVEGHFEVRPPAGWVPPPSDEPHAAPIPMPTRAPEQPQPGLPRPVTPPSDDLAPPPDAPAHFEPAPTPVAPPPAMPPPSANEPEPWFSQQRWEPNEDGPALPDVAAPDDLSGAWDAEEPAPPGPMERLTEWFRRDTQTAVVVLLVGSFAALLVLLTLIRLFGG